MSEDESQTITWNPAEDSKKAASNYLDNLLKTISENFEPGTEEDFSDHYTTQAIFRSLQDIFPSGSYTKEDVFKKLVQLGFKHVLIGSDIQYEWLLKRKESR